MSNSRELRLKMPAHFLRAAMTVGIAMALMAPANASPGAIPATPGVGMASCQPVGNTGHRLCTLPLNKSLILDLPADAHDVLVSNPSIADVVVRTSRRIYLTGIAVGQTNLFVFDGAGNTIVSLDLQVERDITGLEDTLNRLIPGSAITVEIINDNIVLWGTVQNAADASRAAQLANIFVTGGAATTGATGNQTDMAGAAIQVGTTQAQAPTSTIVNLLTIEGQDQVMLKVTVAEVQRDTVKQLGIDWNLSNLQVGGGMLFSAMTNAVFPANLVQPGNGVTAQHLQNITIPDGGVTDGTTTNALSVIGATIQALEQTGLMHTLAEPTLTAISGESASFLAGGEFPVPTSTDANGNVTVEYKPFGVSLSFTPVVLSEGRISLHIQTEVSELTGTGALSVGGITMPGLNVRRAETTLELPSGGALVMSGLLQDTQHEVISGLPGIRNVPILGALFGSRDFQHNETELVIIVTPYIVNPVAPSELARPGDGLATAGDLRANFLGQLNLRYGAQGAAGQNGYYGNPGFIIQ